VPVVVIELLLVVAVYGGAAATDKERLLAHGDRVTAHVTASTSSCKGSDCAWTSYGDYVVAGHQERHVQLRCCAPQPLKGEVRVAVDASSPRSPQLVGASFTRDKVLGLGAAVVLVVGNAALPWVRRRRRARTLV